MLNVVTLLWDHNEQSQWFSRCYDESWVLRLFAGFRRNLNRPFRPVLFTEKLRDIPGVLQIMISTDRPGYGHCIEPYKLDEPMILCGLDTVVVGNCDPLAEYCMTADCVALPRDPNWPSRVCNGVALVPAGQKAIYDRWHGENDMVWMRNQSHIMIDRVFPGMVESYKGKVKKTGLEDCRICYFHGAEKPHELLEKEPWIKQHWIG